MLMCVTSYLVSLMPSFTSMEVTSSAKLLLRKKSGSLVNFPNKIRICSIHQIFDLGLPFGHANGPGLESECKNLENSKYCHNYYSMYFDVPDGYLSKSKCINCSSDDYFVFSLLR